MTTVVFACVQSAGRSQMAAAFFNAAANPTRARAVSAGTAPAESVHPEVVTAMREVGLDLTDAKPRLLTDELAREAAILVTMGCGEACPVIPGVERQDWPLTDPKHLPLDQVRAIRDDIRARVEALVRVRGWTAKSKLAERPLVLFVCTHNAARSQMAEALLRKHAGDRFAVASAGLHPTAVHPLTRRVLEEIGVPATVLHAKPTKDFLGRAAVRYAIIVCARAEAECPRVFPFTTQTLSWAFDDPTAREGSEELQLAKFRRVRDEIDVRIREWLRQVRPA